MVSRAERVGSLRDVVGHAVVTLRRTPGRALAFGAAAFVAAALLTVGVTDAASRQADVNSAFDKLAAQRVQVTTPLIGSPYRQLSPAQLSAISELPGVTGVAWGTSRSVLVRDQAGEVTSTYMWTLDGDLNVLDLEFEGGHTSANRALFVGGANVLAGDGAKPFEHATIAGRRMIVGNIVTKSPAISGLLDTTATVGVGKPPALNADGEIVVGVKAGWATTVAPRLAAILSPGRESSVLVRYPPEASSLRSGVLGSVDSLVYVTSAAILALGAGAVMVGTFFRVLAERRLLGLYRAIGGSASFVVLTLLIEAAIIGTFGSLFGTTVGLGIAAARSLAAGTPLAVPWLLVAAGAVIGLITNAVAALLPALHTVRETPLKAIRSR